MLISESYKEEQRKLHQQREDYGVASLSYAPLVSQIIDTYKVSELLDYGCGKARLKDALITERNISYIGYDPAISTIDSLPSPAEMVTCIDVLEHIEPSLLNAVLDDLKRVTLKVAFITIHTGAAVKTLSDGRNAHLIQQNYQWWLPKIWKRFHMIKYEKTKGGFYLILQPKPEQNRKNLLERLYYKLVN